MSKFLFFDMDGTLISSNRTILPSTIEALKKAQTNGCMVFLCTGRGLSMAKEYQDVLEIPGIVFANGGGIYWQGKVLETRDIHPSIINDMRRLIEHLNGGYQLLGVSNCWQNPKETKRFEKRMATYNNGLTVEENFKRRGMKPLTTYNNESIQKVDFNFDSELIADIFLSRVPQHLNLVVNGGYFSGFGKRSGEITATNVSKGTAIKRVVEMFSGDMKDTYGFGDSANDKEMLEVCHHSIAMGNASDDIKKLANYVTDDNDHDGIYKALKHFEII